MEWEKKQHEAGIRPAPRGRRPRRWLPELGDRQHQPHQVHLPGDWPFAVDLLQVPVDGIFRESRRPGDVTHALAVGQPDRHLTLGRRQPQRPGDHVGVETRMAPRLVLLVEPGGHPRLEPDVVARTLGLTPAESQVAVWVADGKSVRDIATATGLTENAIYWHLKQIYRKLPISRQVDLVRLVLSIAEFG